MSSIYNVTTDVHLFRKVLADVFGRRELLTIMSVITCYNEARTTAYDKGLSFASIDFYALCKEAEDDDINSDTIKLFLEKLSVVK